MAVKIHEIPEKITLQTERMGRCTFGMMSVCCLAIKGNQTWTLCDTFIFALLMECHDNPSVCQGCKYIISFKKTGP